jgi:hypothetical protein
MRKNASLTIFQNDHPGMSLDILGDICEAVSKGDPVTFCLTWPDVAPSFDYTHTVDTFSSCKGGGHALLAVGYELGAEWEGGGRIQFINSWGPNWADHGFAWVTFAYLQRTGGWAYVMRLHPQR